MNEERIYTEESYKGYSIKIMYDSCPDCPTKCWDMCGAFLWEYSNIHRLSDDCHWEQVYGKHGSNDHSLEDALMNLINDNANLDKIYKYFKNENSNVKLYYDRSLRRWVFEEWSEYRKKYIEVLTCTSDEYKSGDYLWEMLESRDKDELIDILDKCADNIAIYEWSSTGYSQGDYVEGVAFMTKEMADKNLFVENGKDWKKVAKEAMDAGSKSIGAWMWGDVYGWVTEDDEGDQIDSCWGYYGDDEIDYMISEAKNNIDSYIARREEEHEERLKKVKANIDKLKGKIFIGHPDCFLVDDYFGETVIRKCDSSLGWVENFQGDIDVKDIPGDILMSMEKTITQLTTKN